jgi:hypothetical protein
LAASSSSRRSSGSKRIRNGLSRCSPVEIKGRHAGDPAELPGLLNTTAETFTVDELSGDKAYASILNFQAALHFFRFNQDEFYKHYHLRSNVESTFSMIKAKFRDHVRSKTETAMKNEVLCKILCHNICCLISAFYELGIDSEFGRVASMRA